VRQITHVLLYPVVGWLALNLAYLGWHIPAAYELALRSEAWDEVEHACFFFTSLLFWWTVLQPWPSRSACSRWAVIPYLLSADFVNTALSAFFAFSARLLYPSYADAPRVLALSPLNDQIAAGAFMWVAGSLLYVVPAVATVFRLANSLNASLTGGASERSLSF
jgi:putative membrane protein